MTMPPPILAIAFMIAAAAILTIRETVAAESRKSKVHSRPRRPANVKTQG